MTDRNGTGDGDAPDVVSLTVAPGILAAPALLGVVGIGASRAELGIDQVERALSIAEIVAQVGPHELPAPGGRLGVTVVGRPGRLEVSVGPLRDGGHRRLLDAIQRLATTATSVAGADGERLIIELTADGQQDAGDPTIQEEERAPEFGVALVPGDSGVHIVAIRGEVDIFTAPEVKRAAREAVFAGGNLIVLDLSDTTFIDSTGLGVIIGLAKLVRPAGDLAIVNVDPAIAKTLAITGLDDIFAVRATRAEAIAALTRR